ncbi:MAG: DUF1778 domain-containing protein [Actinomycetota bacterium]
MKTDQEQAKTERMWFRVSPMDKDLFDDASREEGTNVSEFVIAAARSAAVNVLSDRRRFMLPEADWDSFQAALESPARELPRLRKLLETPTILDT